MRNRSEADRRHSVTIIGEKGLELLDQIKTKLSKVNEQFYQKLSAVEWVALTSICEKIHAGQSETNENEVESHFLV